MPAGIASINASQSNQVPVMTQFRFIPLALALAVASTLIACNTVPAMPMGTAAAGTMGTPDQMARMDAQMQAMRTMHEKMMAAKTPEERNRMMAEHMKTMQDSMQMMKGMGGAGMGHMKGMPGMTAEMTAHHQMMEKRMQMMETMMSMMMDHMPAPASR
jgi:hypothetical protein